MGLHSSLEVYNLVTSLAIIYKQLFCWDVAILQINAGVVCFGFESIRIDLCAQLLTPGVSQSVLQLFSLFKASSVESLSEVCSRCLRGRTTMGFLTFSRALHCWNGWLSRG